MRTLTDFLLKTKPGFRRSKSLLLGVMALLLVFTVSCNDDETPQTPDGGETPEGEATRTALEEATLIATLGANEANRTLEDFNGSSRNFADELNVFLPSLISVEESTLRDNARANATLPIYEGVNQDGEPTYFIITETSTMETARVLGAILSPKLRFGALPAAANSAQRVEVDEDGRIIFRGDVDFSPERRLEGTSLFDLTTVQPGAVGDAEYSSLVVLPSGLVINAQIIANASGTHDRINEINIEERWANFQLLDGWQGGDRYYYHLVTDASDPGPATIELGVYAPRMANLPTFGVSNVDDPESVLLGFSPNANGLTTFNDGVGEALRQGLSSTVVDNDLDPVNVFPFDPDNDNPNNNYSPMWDAHISQWTEAAITGPNGDVRRPITSFEDLTGLVQAGLVSNFEGSPGRDNTFVAGLRASNAVINCPVILQPFEGQRDENYPENLPARTQLQEAQAIAALGAREAGRPLGDFTGADRNFRDELNVFLPSTISVASDEDLRDNTEAEARLPLYEGVGPSGEPTYFIITETSTPETAEALGAILSPKLRFGALPSAAAAAQRVEIDNQGRIIFRGDVDFSPVRRLEGTSLFDLTDVQPGAVGDDEYSSLVVLPSGLVINAQIVANGTGAHDRINRMNIAERWADFQLLDGWQGGDRYYYHLVTDASDRVPATIELGVYAPRMANLPTFGVSNVSDTESVLLGFSPNANGLTISDNGVAERDRQGLSSTVVDNDLDPVNVFPFDPDNSDPNNNYSPMWDAHISMWTDEAINGPNGDQRRTIKGFQDLNDLINQGLITSFSGSPADAQTNDFVFGLRASNAVINCPVIMQPFEGQTPDQDPNLPRPRTAIEEATVIATLGAKEARKSLEEWNGSNRSFRDELNVFLPSTISLPDDAILRDNERANVNLPIYEGVGPSGEPTYYIITETSTPETAEILGAILSPKLRYGALPSAAAAAQRVQIDAQGRIIFRGDVDFSPERILEGDAFPPTRAEPGARGDDEYSSLVVLPSGLVINAQIVHNSTGTHDRINTIDVPQRWANFQLLDGWQGGDRYYYHLVTDASAIGPATIELGVYAPRMANLPVFGQSGLDGETVLLGFSPNVNGLTIRDNGASELDRQGLGSTIVDNDLDPVNIFPFDPNNSDPNNNYSPMWDAHLNMWTDEAINGPNGDQRRAITSFSDLQQLIDLGLITSFSGSEGINNDFVFGLRASNAVINCPVILQPFEGNN